MFHLFLVIGLVILGLWLLGIITSTTFGGAIYVLLVISAILIFIWIVMFILKRTK